MAKEQGTPKRMPPARIDLVVESDETGGGHSWKYRQRSENIELCRASAAGQESFERLEAVLLGAVQAINTTAVGQRVVVRTAETALIQGTREIARWNRSGWLNPAGDPVPHREFWEKIQSPAAARAIAWHMPLGVAIEHRENGSVRCCVACCGSSNQSRHEVRKVVVDFQGAFPREKCLVLFSHL